MIFPFISGYFRDYRFLPITWLYRCYLGSWTPRCARWFNSLSSTIWSYCIFWITQRGKC